MGWTFEDATAQNGRTFLITGANSGIGLEAAWMLAERGGRVILACRSDEKIEAAKRQVRERTSNGVLHGVILDLASLESICSAASKIKDHPPLDGLVNNAGVMAIPRQLTRDGFEMQFGTNHLGHFALTASLTDHLAPQGRVVNVSSVYHHRGVINFDDLMGERSYNKWTAYAQSKLANMLFTFELQRYFERVGKSAFATACHPGYANTNLQMVGPRSEKSALLLNVMRLANRVIAQPAEQGAWPTVRAATEPDIRGGEFYGPDGLLEIRGEVAPAKVASHARDASVAKRLWDVSLELTGAQYA